MRKIAIFNAKGGVGKTTTSVNLAAGLARNNKKVLLIDLDPQGDISACHNVDAKYNLYDFMMEGAYFNECVTKLGKNLDLIHCDHKMADAEQKMSKDDEPVSYFDRKMSLKLDYDYILLDCPPSFRLLNKNALHYASEVIIPCSTDVLGFGALQKTVERINDLKKFSGKNLHISSILPTMFDSRNKISKEILAKMKSEYTPLIVTDPIRSNSKLKEAPKAKMSIFTYDKKSSGAEDYWKFVKLVLENEYMYDLKLPQAQREKSMKDYFVNGKKRELMIVDGKVTFGFKFVSNVADSLKNHFAEPKKNKKSQSHA